MQVINMAYFLKKTNLKKGQYLQIYDSFYDPEKGRSANKSFQAIGYTHELIAKGIKDPLKHFQLEVDELNKKKKSENNKSVDRQIGTESPEKYLGYFPIKNINDGLRVKRHIDLLQTNYKFEFNAFDVLSSLIYARMMKPSSKLRTFHDTIPKLFDKYNFSENQMYAAIEFVGSEYEKIIEIYNHEVNKKFKLDTSVGYFDCTNFYFEIDKEDKIRKKGMSKERRTDPIIGMGLLLDSNQIPLGMKMYPGNQSEMPVIKEVIDEMKIRHNITGRTIRVADKGLNSADNIANAVRNGDGYIFSKSVKKLSDKEKVWVQSKNDYQKVLKPDGQVAYEFKEWTDNFEYTITGLNGKKMNVQYYEKRVVTYNPVLARKKEIEIQRQITKATNLQTAHAKKSEYGDSSKYVVFESTDDTGIATDNKIKVSLNMNKISEDLKLAGYNMIVTSEVKLNAEEVYETYHNLWRIEESFRIMKTDLDARPVYLQKEESIYGHFLICYLAVLLLRLLQFKILENKFCSNEIINYVRDLRVVEISKTKYVNLSKTTPIAKHLAQKYELPSTSYFMNNQQIKIVLNHRFR